LCIIYLLYYLFIIYCIIYLLFIVLYDNKQLHYCVILMHRNFAYSLCDSRAKGILYQCIDAIGLDDRYSI